MGLCKSFSISILTLTILSLNTYQVKAIPGFDQFDKWLPKTQKTSEPAQKPEIKKNESLETNKVNEVDKKINSLKEEISLSRNESKVRVILKEGTSSEKVLSEIPTYLTFTNNYLDKSKDLLEFNGKDFIYGKLTLPKKIIEYLPKPDDSNVEYYRVKIIARSGYKETENSHKLPKKDAFKLAYNTNELLVAIVPEKSFFEQMLMNYKKDDKFISAKKEVEGYQDILSRNFSRQISEMLKELPIGINKVDIIFEITAKLKGSDFQQINSAKGSFLIKIDDEAIEKYGNTYNLLTDLYKEYDDKRSIASQTVSEQAEKEMLKNMSPRDQERYKIAKNSTEGYMAAYKGEKGTCNFNLDALRDKTAHIDIVWNDGGVGKEAGRHGFFITPNFRNKVKNVPIGATISINGRTLVQKVTGNHNITIYWYY